MKHNIHPVNVIYIRLDLGVFLDPFEFWSVCHGGSLGLWNMPRMTKNWGVRKARIRILTTTIVNHLRFTVWHFVKPLVSFHVQSHSTFVALETTLVPDLEINRLMFSIIDNFLIFCLPSYLVQALEFLQRINRFLTFGTAFAHCLVVLITLLLAAINGICLQIQQITKVNLNLAQVVQPSLIN